jgi:hypothetical protein
MEEVPAALREEVQSDNRAFIEEQEKEIRRVRIHSLSLSSYPQPITFSFLSASLSALPPSCSHHFLLSNVPLPP